MVCGVLYSGVCVGTGDMCSPDRGWGVFWARIERYLGVRGFLVCVVFTVLHGLWASSVVVRMAGG